MKQALTTQQIAALAAGAAPEAAGAPAPAAAAPAPAAEAGAEGGPAPAATPAAPAAAENAPAPVAQTESAKPDAIVTFLQGENSRLNGELAAANLRVSQAESSVAAMKATHDALKTIAGQALRNMKVALGHSGFDASTFSAEQILAEHSTTLAAFQSSFPAGGVSSGSAAAVKKPAPTNPLAAAKLAATQF